MKILWLTNVLPHFLAKKINETTINNLGWLDYSAEMLTEKKDVELTIIFPSEKKLIGAVDKINYQSFPMEYRLQRNDAVLTEIFKDLLIKIQPDVIHIYGTEYYHTVAMAKASKMLNMDSKTIISIQGLVSVYAHHFAAGLSDEIMKKYTFRDFIKHENITEQKNAFVTRGMAEVEALQIIDNVIGRTEWDKACTYQINPKRKYYFCNETLRKPFYDGIWSEEMCEKHSMFVSQSSYSIKALHQVIEALPYVLRDFPDAKVYVTGVDILKRKWYRINSYHAYLRKRISQLNLQDKIIFLGSLNADEMKAYFIKCNVFLMPSSVENSPNSLGEAMILGVPSVVADVGGISSVFTHEKDGFLYPFDAPYMLAHYICRIFSEPQTVGAFTEASRKHASHTHDPKKNADDLYDIYHSLLK